MKQIPIALALYTVREDAAKNLPATLGALAAIGFRNVELSGFYGRSALEIKKLLEQYELKAVAAHVGLDELQGAQAGRTFEDYIDLGVTTLIVPHVGEDVRGNGEGYAVVADRLNAVGETAARFGLTVGYHNHAFEFTESFGGKTGIEILVEGTDPSLVTFEIDTYWALSAGADPVGFIERHATRVSLLHIKDMDAADRTFAPVGTGVLPLGGIVDAAVEAGVRYLIVEQDRSKAAMLNDIRISYDNLQAKGYV